MEALQAGAVDIMEKPGGSFSAHGDGARLAEKIRAAAGARVRARSEETALLTRRPTRSQRQWRGPLPILSRAQNHFARGLDRAAPRR